jgi:glycosyltransferase involved in cell wall biosynthesis
MRVLVNQWLASGDKTGIGHYAAELYRALRARAPGDEFLGYPPPWLQRLRGFRAVRHRQSAGLPAGASNGRSRRWLRNCSQAVLAAHFRAYTAFRDFDVYHEPNYIPLPSDRPTVATIHDLSLLVRPEWHPADRVAWFERNLARMVQQCGHFIAVSEFSRREAIRHLGIPSRRITAVYNGIRAHLAPLPPGQVAERLWSLGLPSRYLLHVGTIEPRKNLLVLLKAYCALPDRLRAQWPLVLVGRWGWNADAEADYLRDEALHRGVIHLGYVAEQHLPVLYNGARALVYPTLYEGFGFPPVEMMACGGAVLASTAGAVAEVVAGRGHLLDPEDVDAWRLALARVLTDDDWLQSLRADAVAAARAYTWERCAEETLKVYQALGKGGLAREPRPAKAA